MGVITGLVKTTHETVLHTQSAPDCPAVLSRVRVTPRRLRPMVSDAVLKQWDDLLKTSVYWAAVDWRRTLDGENWRDGLTHHHRQPSTNVLQPFDDRTNPACVGYAVAAGLRANLVEHRRGPDGKRVDPGQLSPFFIWGLARERDAFLRSPRCGLLDDAMRVVNQYGAPPVAKGPRLPDIAPPFTSNASQYLDDAAPNKIQSIVDTGVFLGDLAAWLHFQGPVVAQINIQHETFDDLGPDAVIEYEPGLVDDSDVTSIYGSHAVLIVGWNHVDAEEHPGSFIIMNSFGTSWGDLGFAYLPLQVAQQCVIASYGLLFREQLSYTKEGTLIPPPPSALRRSP